MGTKSWCRAAHHSHHLFVAGHAGYTIHTPVELKQGGRRGNEPQVLEQMIVAEDAVLDLTRLGGSDDFFTRVVALKCRLGIVGAKQCRRLGRAVRLEHADHDMSQLHLAGFDPGSCGLPKLATVRAVGVGKGIDYPRGGAVAVQNPVPLFQLLPDLGILGGAYVLIQGGGG